MRKRFNFFRKRLKVFSRHPIAVPVITVGVLSFLSLIGFIIIKANSSPAPVATQVVIISHDDETQIVPSREKTVAALLKKLDITLNQGDVVEPAANTVIDQDQFRVNIYRAVPVQIDDNGSLSYAYSAATTARSIAAQASVKTYAEDDVSTAPVVDFVAERAIGQRIAIDRATAVNVRLYGTQLDVRTRADTVGALLKEKDIKLSDGDRVTPAADQPLAAGTQVTVVRDGTALVNETQPIAPPVQTIQDPNLAYGTSAVRQQGTAGQQVVTYQVKTENGKEVSRTTVQTVVTSPAVAQIVAQGVNLGGIKGDMALAGISPADYTFVDYIIGKESGWRPTAQNASGAYGLCQALPGGKMASAGSDWATNPVTQLRWCDGYAKARYGSWANAYQFWLSHRYW